jgi:uncharacterized protein YqjF (DUF2071 family)
MERVQLEKQNGQISVREFVANAGHKCLTFLDLDATERYGKEQYRNGN